MKKLLFGSMLLMLVAAYASNKENKSTYAFAQRNAITDTVPQDTSDTTHHPDSLFLANFLAKN